MGDIVDRANDLVDANREDLTRHIQRQTAPETHPDFDGRHCVDCGLEIPQQRLAMGRVRCVLCQRAIEYKRRTKQIS